jgi:hypothetical protein
MGGRPPGLALSRTPRALAFRKPIDRGVRLEDLPAELSWGIGKSLKLLRFYDGGVTITFKPSSPSPLIRSSSGHSPAVSTNACRSERGMSPFHPL